MSILKKFGRAIIAGICMFIIMFVMYKLFMDNEEWLLDAIIWSSTWAAGHFLARCFTEGGSNDADVRIMYNIGAIFVAFIITAFVCGIILEKNTYYLSGSVCFFGLQSCIFNQNMLKCYGKYFISTA